jgi:hypothetical protein
MDENILLRVKHEDRSRGTQQWSLILKKVEAKHRQRKMSSFSAD